MKLYSENKDYKLYHGNMLDMLEVIEPNTIDSIVCDPPYELNFMGKGWDNSGIAFQKETWKKCFEVLKPGGYLLAFGGSRTFHRIACAIEDAGFEIRDTIMWIYGSGFPKSMNIGLAIDKKLGVESKVIGKAYKGSNPLAGNHNGTWADNQKDGEYEIKKAQNEWQGWGTALKPSFEPIIVARKPFKGSLVDNVIEYGVGGINIDECRVEGTQEYLNGKGNETIKEYNNNIYQFNSNKLHIRGNPNKLGRFPANTILTYDDTDCDEVCGGFPNTKSTGGKRNDEKTTSIMNVPFANHKSGEHYVDSGSASRYFMNCKYTGKDEEFRRYIYAPKASKKDRDEGLDEFEETKGIRSNAPRTNEDVKTKPRKNIHPTVKPTDLMQYLVRLVTPNNGTILDPFNGSGSTGKAVMYENKEHNKNYKYIGIELTEEYLPIAKARIEYVCNLPVKEEQTNIFDFVGDSNE